MYFKKPETFPRLPPQSVLMSQNNGSPWSLPRSAPLLPPPHASCHSESGIAILLTFNTATLQSNQKTVYNCYHCKDMSIINKCITLS